MPAGRDPLATDHHGDYIVELQRQNRCPAASGQANDARAIFIGDQAHDSSGSRSPRRTASWSACWLVNQVQGCELGLSTASHSADAAWFRRSSAEMKTNDARLLASS